MTANSSAPIRAPSASERNGVDDRVGDRPQDGISGNMPVDVVDVLEPVEIDDEHRHLLAVAARFGDDAVADLVDRAEG